MKRMIQYEDDLQQIQFYGYNVTTSTTTDVIAAYKITPELTPVYTDYIRVLPDFNSFFPTRRELNRLAAIEGGHAMRTLHVRIPRKALVFRASYQDSPRRPCYRGRRCR